MKDRNVYPYLLLNVNKFNSGALTCVLTLDEEGDLKQMIGKILGEPYSFPKLTLTTEAFCSMYNCVSYQGEWYLECLDLFLKPIVEEKQVQMLALPINPLKHYD